MNKVFEQFGGLIADLKEVASKSFVLGSIQAMPANMTIKFGRTLNEISSMPFSAKMGFSIALTELVGDFRIRVEICDNEDSNKIFRAELIEGDNKVLPEECSREAFGNIAEVAVESVLEEIVHHYINTVAKSNQIPQ